MDKHEMEIRELKKEGYTCSAAINMVFARDDSRISKEYPEPRSIDGKCGALLAAFKILDETGHGDKKEEFEKEFIEKFKFSKCVDLMRFEARCVDYVGEAAKMLDEILNI